jgi:hypothetical protein
MFQAPVSVTTRGLEKNVLSWDLHKVLHTRIKLQDVQVIPERKGLICRAF